jgi:hypothetical protein
MSARWQSVAVAALVVLGACGGGSGESRAPEADPSTASAESTAGEERASTGLPPRAATAVIPAPAGVDVIAALADRATLGAALERDLVGALVTASGLAAVLGPDTAAAVDDLLAAEDTAVRAEWATRGIDPAAAEAALRAEPVLPPPGAAHVLRESMAGAGGVLALVTSMIAAFEPVFMKKPDVSGHITDTVTVDATSTRDGLTLTLDERATVDLMLCPDEGGLAEGTVTVEVDLMATGTMKGEPTSLRASGTFSIATEVTANGDAHLANTDNHVTGTIVATADDGDTSTWADVDGLGVPLGFGEDGEVESGKPHGEAVGVEETIDQLIETFAKSGAVMAMMHGKSAETFWSDGGCVMLEVNAVPASEVGESAEVLVTATHKVDLGPVDGTVKATAGSGTVDPESAEVPATFRITVAPGDTFAYADFEQRSCRGVATGQGNVDARGYVVAVGGPNQVSLSGTKCEGPVGTWNLVFGGVVNDGGFEVTFSGFVNFEVAADLSATYVVDMRLDASNLPPALAAQLGISGGGTARFVDDFEPRFDILDGDLAVAASGSGPGVSINGIVQQGPTGASSLPVQRAACG